MGEKEIGWGDGLAWEEQGGSSKVGWGEGWGVGRRRQGGGRERGWEERARVDQNE